MIAALGKKITGESSAGQVTWGLLSRPGEPVDAGFGVSYASFVIPNGFGHRAVVSQRIAVCGSGERSPMNNFLLLGESDGCSLPKR